MSAQKKKSKDKDKMFIPKDTKMKSFFDIFGGYREKTNSNLQLLSSRLS